MKPRVLVICTGNSMRSQMAEGVLRKELGDRIYVFSAGIQPSFVHPDVIAILQEIGVDTRKQRSKSVTEFLAEPLDLVITLCDYAAEQCPPLPLARKTLHKGYPDPTRSSRSEDPYKSLREMRDHMRIELTGLVTSELGL